MRLHPEQQYIADIATELHIPFELKRHHVETITCAEKAALIGWPLDRVVKALYLHTGDYSDGHIGVIIPEIGRIDSQQIIRTTLGMDKKSAKRYSINGYVPSGMSIGTCTPFPKESVMLSEISHLIIVEHSLIISQLVDISMGDEFDDPKKVSMHIPYSGIRTILAQRFGGKIYVAESPLQQ